MVSTPGFMVWYGFHHVSTWFQRWRRLRQSHELSFYHSLIIQWSNNHRFHVCQFFLYFRNQMLGHRKNKSLLKLRACTHNLFDTCKILVLFCWDLYWIESELEQITLQIARIAKPKITINSTPVSSSNTVTTELFYCFVTRSSLRSIIEKKRKEWYIILKAQCFWKRVYTFSFAFRLTPSSGV